MIDTPTYDPIVHDRIVHDPIVSNINKNRRRICVTTQRGENFAKISAKLKLLDSHVIAPILTSTVAHSSLGPDFRIWTFTW